MSTPIFFYETWWSLLCSIVSVDKTLLWAVHLTSWVFHFTFYFILTFFQRVYLLIKFHFHILNCFYACIQALVFSWPSFSHLFVSSLVPSTFNGCFKITVLCTSWVSFLITMVLIFGGNTFFYYCFWFCNGTSASGARSLVVSWSGYFACV